MRHSVFSFWTYIVFWCAYLLQGAIFSENTILGQAILIVLVLWSLYHVFYIHFKCRLPSFIRILDILLFVFLVYGLILLMSGEIIINRNGVAVSNLSYSRNILVSLLPIYSFFYYSSRGIISLKDIKICTVVLLFVAIVSFFQYQSKAIINDEVGIGEITNNQAYLFLFLLPYLYLFNNKIIKYIGILSCCIFLFFSMKRGAIIIGALCLVFILFEIIKTSKSAGKLFTLLGSIVVVLVLYRITLFEYKTNPYFVFRVEQTLEGYSSGRDELVDRLIDIYFHEYSYSQQLFGTGANSTIKYVSQYAHNDWLEILINQGLFGAALYLVFWISLFICWRKINAPRDVIRAFGMLIMILFLKTFFSMSYSDVGFYGALLMGYGLSLSARSHEEAV